jgi:hypothetical protein
MEAPSIMIDLFEQSACPEVGAVIWCDSASTNAEA